MPIDRIEVKKALDLVSNLARLISRAIIVRSSFSILAPVMNESLKHAKRPQLIELSKSSEGGESRRPRSKYLVQLPNVNGFWSRIK